MLISSLVGVAAMVTLQRDPTQAARDAYSRCMFAYADAQASERTSLSDFETRLPQQCQSEERAYRDAIRSFQASMRTPQAEIDEITTMEVDDTRANTKSRFEDATTPR